MVRRANPVAYIVFIYNPSVVRSRNVNNLRFFIAEKFMQVPFQMGQEKKL